MKLLPLLIAIWTLPLFGQTIDEQLSSAYSFYQAGEMTDAPLERQIAFNNALAAYGRLEEDYPQSLVSYNLGNCYFQLGQYPWSILYYQRALKQSPRDRRILENLAVAEEHAGIHRSTSALLSPILLYPHQRFSIAERRIALAWITLVAGIAASWMIWRPSRWLRHALVFAIAAMAVVVVSLAYSEIFSTPQAVIVESTPLYKDAGEQYATVGSSWLLAGTTLEVLGFTKESAWVEVENDKAQRGFVPAVSIRVI